MSVRAEQLRDAVLDMVSRYGESERGIFLTGPGAEQRRHIRAANRRFKAIMRLTAALRDIDRKETSA
jgi:hypothetical protein